MVFGRVHRLFLQVMLERRTVDEIEAQRVLANCCKEFGEPVQQLEPFVYEVNRELENVELALKTTVEEREHSDCPCLVLVNLMTGEANRMLSTFSQQELSFVQILVAELVSSSDGEVRISTAINLGLSLKQKMKASMCEKLMERLVEEKWLLQTNYEDGDVYLSLGSLITAEINTYLEETFAEEINKCFFCTKLTFKGYRCQQCEVAVHRDCAKKYWKTCKNTNSCPREGCDEYLGPHPTTTTASQGKRRRTVPDSDEEMEEGEQSEEEEEEEEEEEQQQQQQQVVHRRSRSQRERRKVIQ